MHKLVQLPAARLLRSQPLSSPCHKHRQRTPSSGSWHENASRGSPCYPPVPRHARRSPAVPIGAASTRRWSCATLFAAWTARASPPLKILWCAAFTRTSHRSDAMGRGTNTAVQEANSPDTKQDSMSAAWPTHRASRKRTRARSMYAQMRQTQPSPLSLLRRNDACGAWEL